MSNDKQPAVPTLLAFQRRAIEDAIHSAENPTGMHLNDGKDSVRLPGGTLRRMLAIIDAQAAALQNSTRQQEVSIGAGSGADFKETPADVPLPEPDWWVACTRGYRSWDVFTDDPSSHPEYKPETARPLYTADQMREYGAACAAAAIEAAKQDEREIDVAADAYHQIAKIMGTLAGYSVQEHVEAMRAVLEDCSDFLHDFDEESDPEGVRLAAEVRNTLRGRIDLVDVEMKTAKPATLTDERIGEILESVTSDGPDFDWDYALAFARAVLAAAKPAAVPSEWRELLDLPYMHHHKMTPRQEGFADGWNELRACLLAASKGNT
jgi:hypothetical protein